MSQTAWIRVSPRESIPLREGRAVTIGDRELAIFNLGDRFLAVDGRCPHRGGPLCDGIVAGETVVCPLHAWKINLRRGDVERPVNTTACVHTYPTRVEEGIVMVQVGAADTGRAADTPLREQIVLTIPAARI